MDSEVVSGEVSVTGLAILSTLVRRREQDTIRHFEKHRPYVLANQEHIIGDILGLPGFIGDYK